MDILTFAGEHRFLSNFYPCKVFYEGLIFPTSEHAYQAAKTLCPNGRRTIQAMPTPEQAKRAGKFLSKRPDWNAVRVEAMHAILRQKFCNPELSAKLLATDPFLLIEGNHWGDTFWGVCRGKGKNQLGLLLMQVRDELLLQLKQLSDELSTNPRGAQ